MNTGEQAEGRWKEQSPDPTGPRQKTDGSDSNAVEPDKIWI